MEKRVPRRSVIAPLAPFIERREPMKGLARAFADRHRLVTIIGPPGIGKSRLALRFGEKGRWPSRGKGAPLVCDVSLALLASDLAVEMKRALGLRTSVQGEDDAVADVAHALLRRGSLLVILDNFERIRAGGADMVRKWCEAAPETIFLVTSRERLSVPGEAILELGAMDLPSRGMSARAALRVESLALFRMRARAVGAFHPALDRDPTDVVELVRRLEGIPLAIELAAARCRVLSPADLLARLVVAPAREPPAGKAPPERTSAPGDRHATLEAAMDGSWEMLSEDEKRVLAELSVFSGDFSLEAAASVIAPDEEPRALDLLAALRDKSLVRASRATRDVVRFSLYRSIQEYGARRLRERTGEGEAWERHAEHYARASEAPLRAFARTGDARARAWLRDEKENLRTAERRLAAKATLTCEDARCLARIVAALAPTLGAEGAFEEWTRMLEDGIRAADAASEDGALSAVLIARATMRGLRGENLLALSDLERALSSALACRDRSLEAEALLHVSVRNRVLGRFEESRRVSEKVFEITKESGDTRIEGQNHAITGLLLLEQGDILASRRHNERARAILRASDPWSEAFAIANLAQIAQSEGAFERADKGYERALRAFRDEGDLRYEARYLGCRAGLEQERGNLRSARRLYEESVARLASLRMRPSEALFRAGLGAALAGLGHEDDARIVFEEAALLLEGTEEGPVHAVLQLHMGHLELGEAARSAKRDSDATDRKVEAARARIGAAAPWRPRSEDVRFASRLLERACAAMDAKRSRSRLESASLVVARDGTWFRLRGKKRVDLGRKGADRRIFASLVEQRFLACATPLTVADLVERGWPGERVLPSAGALRVRVSIASLRRLGLAKHLVTEGDRYMLEEKASIALAEEDL